MAIDSFEACQLKSEKRWSDIKLEIQKIKDDQQTMTARLNKQAAMVEDIQELSKAVAKLATNMEAMLQEQKSQNERLHTLEDKPRKRAEDIFDTILKIVITAAMGVILLKVGIA